MNFQLPDWRSAIYAGLIGAFLQVGAVGIADADVMFTTAWLRSVGAAAFTGFFTGCGVFLRGLATQPAADRYVPGVTPERRRTGTTGEMPAVRQ